MPTNRKRMARRPVIYEEPLSEAMEHYFIHGKLINLPGMNDLFRLMKHPEKIRDLWLKYREQILRKHSSPWAEENLLEMCEDYLRSRGK